ncbi:coiled-coil domain-containing protein [Aeoliella mucimassa]|uniref:Chromosome partition protein Smc n=1 Tax=Aeoliella mucimassa TaxID=2527972 RepID=A0A518AI32_9BACT|nr:hypothetical protein [Aeoliella mucimassa]QDU54375.1 hypothetical protein Pan181_05560 [Aeoliella mucimassa]
MMKRYANTMLTLFVLAAVAAPAPSSAQEAASSLPGVVNISTSLLITGGSSEPPLDESSLSALFTSGFRSEFKQKLDSLVDEETANQFEVHMMRVDEVSRGDRYQHAFGRVVQLQAAIVNVPPDLRTEVENQSGPLLVEMFTERVGRVWQSEYARQLQTSKQKMERLNQLISELQKKLEIYRRDSVGLKLETIEDADTLRNNYLELKNQQRGARLEQLQLQARREAIEKQLQMLEEQARSIAEEPNVVLTQLKEQLEKSQARLKEELPKNGTWLKDKEEATAKEIEKLQERANLLKDAGEEDSELLRHIEQLRAALHTNQRNYSEAQHLLERDVERSRLAYLQEIDRLKQQKYGDRLAELNTMLTTVLIDLDQLEGQEVPMADEVERAKKAYAQRLNAEVGQKQLELDIETLERELRGAQASLQNLQSVQELLVQPELHITPWGG